MGDLGGGSPVLEPASKETRNLPSSFDLLAPESKSPVLLFFGTLSISSASSGLSSFETTCRMAKSAKEEKELVKEPNKTCKAEREKGAASSRLMRCFILPISLERRTIIMQFQLCHASKMISASPLAQMVSERCIYTASITLAREM